MRQILTQQMYFNLAAHGSIKKNNKNIMEDTLGTAYEITKLFTIQHENTTALLGSSSCNCNHHLLYYVIFVHYYFM